VHHRGGGFFASVRGGLVTDRVALVHLCGENVSGDQRAMFSQGGSGVPQYLSRDSAQSTLLRNQSPYRPHLIVSGYQVVCSFSRNRCALMAVVRMYHAGRA
jgi:hypothetical protein